MDKTIATQIIRVDYIHISFEQSYSHSFKCYTQLKMEKIWKN